MQVKSPSLIYVNAKAPGETVLYAVDAGDSVLLNSPVRVEHDVSRLRQSLQPLMPGEKITANSVDNSLVLSGTVSTAGEAEKAHALAAAIAGETKGSIINEMSVATPNQVNLRVKVAEVEPQVLKRSASTGHRPPARDFSFDTNNPTTGRADHRPLPEPARLHVRTEKSADHCDARRPRAGGPGHRSWPSRT